MSSAITGTLSWLTELLAAALIGGLIAHALTLRRARKDRVREFRSFVVEFRSEAADRFWQRGSFSDHYQSKTSQLVNAADYVANDFSGDRRIEFDRLVTAAAGFAPTQLHGFHERQQLLVPALDAILTFLDKA